MKKPSSRLRPVCRWIGAASTGIKDETLHPGCSFLAADRVPLCFPGAAFFRAINRGLAVDGLAEEFEVSGGIPHKDHGSTHALQSKAARTGLGRQFLPDASHPDSPAKLTD